MNWPPAHPGAEQEFLAQVAELQATTSEAIAEQYVRRAMSVVRRVRRFPYSGSPSIQGTRIVPLRPFKYSLVYLPDVGGDIFLIAFASQRRKPFYWQKRIAGR